MRRTQAFTLVELLVVVAIIALLIAVFLPTLSQIREQLVRLHCKSNLKNIHQVVEAYAGTYKGFLPCSNSFDGIQELQGQNASPRGRFYKLEALMKLGAKAIYFTCPAYDYRYQQVRDGVEPKYAWKDWWVTTPTGTYTWKYVRTYGYNWFIGADNAFVYPHNQADPNAFWCWPLPVDPHRLYNGRPFAKRLDEEGGVPILCDKLRVGKEFQGFHHFVNREPLDPAGSQEACLEPGGGGHTLFLNGAVYWYDWGELEAAGPGYLFRPWSGDEKAAYYFGLVPPR